jgi:predicted nucleic acid-binding protein
MNAVDTNVLIYACDQTDVRRQRLALNLITTTPDCVLLWQVACEFIAASRKLTKQGFTSAQAWDRLTEFRGFMPLVNPTAAILSRAQDLHVSRNVSFWDALILAACAESGVETLYSEDLPGMNDLGALRIVNPFA